MFVDYLTLMLVNMVAGLVMHALFMGRLFERDQKKIIPGYLLTGAIALVTGLAMIFTWPLPSSYNIIFGELTVLFGGFLFMSGLSVALGWDLITVGIYAFFGGAVSVLLGVRIFTLKLTSEPLVAALGFVITGGVGILTLPALAFPKQKWLRILTALAALGSGAIWLIVGFPAYWAHVLSFAKWAPK